jgi:hypothetical protein
MVQAVGPLGKQRKKMTPSWSSRIKEMVCEQSRRAKKNIEGQEELTWT